MLELDSVNKKNNLMCRAGICQPQLEEWVNESVWVNETVPSRWV